MARKRSRSRSQAVQIYRAPAPVIRVSAPRAIATTRAAPKRRRVGGSAVSGGPLRDRMVKVALGGAAIGFIEKSSIAIPTIPVLGRTGTIAVAAYFLGGQRPGLLQDVALAAATMAGYQLARDGRVAGEDDV